MKKVIFERNEDGQIESIHIKKTVGQNELVREYIKPIIENTVDDFYSLPPKCRTKETLKKMLIK